MNDCPNSGVRDRLPDLLHDRLDAGTRAMVQAHVNLCADCRAELELLRGVHGMLMKHAPRVDVSLIVHALPKHAATPVARRAVVRRRVWSDWRVAAAVTLLVAGGGSVAIMHRSPATTAIMDSVPAIVVPSQPAARGQAPASVAIGASVAESAPPRTTATTATVATPDEGDAGSAVGVEASARLGDLDAQQLKALLGQIGNLRPVPVTDPDPVTIRVNPNADSPNGSSL